MNARILHAVEQSLIIVPLFPILLPCEVLILLWQEWRYCRWDVDRTWMADGDVWSGRLSGLRAQEPTSWGAAALVIAALCEWSLIWSGFYLVLAFVVVVWQSRPVT